MVTRTLLAGRLDRRITIEEPSTVQDEFGELDVSWSALATVWARIEPLRGRERFEAQREHAEVDTRIVIRYRTDVDVTKRITYAGQVYDIEAVLEIGRKDGLEILAKAQVP